MEPVQLFSVHSIWVSVPQINPVNAITNILAAIALLATSQATP